METHKITNRLRAVKSQSSIKHLDTGVVLNERYQIQDIVGLGGMGAVYRGRDLRFPKLEKHVAVKEMVNQSPDEEVKKTIVQNFEREANLLATLNHPAIPRILDYFSQGDRSYLVMEFVSGRNLEDILEDRKGPITPDLAISWAIELCDVLQFLHNHKPEPIIFRDMKPSNVMLTPQSRLMLVDFGIAKQFQTGRRGTQVGTEGYSPPEQYRGEATPQADVYALGATLHHLLSNRDPRLEAPFSFADRPLRSLNPAVSAEIEAVINTALQYEPKDRFKDAAMMKQALILAGRRTGQLDDSAFLSDKHTWMLSEAGNVKPVWVFECEDEVRGTATVSQGTVYIGSYDNNLYALDSASGEFKWKFPTDGAVVGKPVVMDTQVLFGSEDGRMYSVSTRSGSLIWSYITSGPIYTSPRIAEGHVFIGSDDGYLHAVNMASQRRSWRYDAGAMIRSSPFVTEESVYFGTEEGDFLCLNFSGGERWRYRANRAITASPVVRDDSVYFSSLDLTLYCMDSVKGWLIWRYRMGKPSISSPGVTEKLVLLGAIDGNLYAVDLRTGREVWKFQAEDQINGGVVFHEDALYFGSVDQHLYCLETRTGKQRWKYKTEGSITGTPIVSEDIIYFGSIDRKVYALLA